MCSDDETLADRELGGRGLVGGVSRRRFIHLAGGAAATGVLLPALGRLPVAAETPTRLWHKLGLHNHGSFSEGQGSWYAALSEAAANGLDVLVMTDHDWRVEAKEHRPRMSFDGMTDTWAGSTWGWSRVREGSPTLSKAWIDRTTYSPYDSSPNKGAMRIAHGKAAGTASTAMELDDRTDGGRIDLSTNITGQSIEIDVRGSGLSKTAWLELELLLSYYPSIGGYPEGRRSLIYRFGRTEGIARSGLTGIVSRQIPFNEWSTQLLDLEADAAAVFPELPVPGDNAMSKLWLRVVSTNTARIDGWFDNLQFHRARSGAAGYDVQREMIDAYAPLFDVEARLGAEISFTASHNVWMFGNVVPIDYGLPPVMKPTPSETNVIRRSMDATVAANGGVLSYAHAFGSGVGVLDTDVAGRVTERADQLLKPGRLDGHSMIEVGYQLRGSVDIDGHLGLWDNLSANGLFLTGIGSTDAHNNFVGQWASSRNRFITSAESVTTSDEDLSAALRAGRAWCAEMGPWVYTEIDLRTPSTPMGGVEAPTSASTDITRVCRPLPTAGRVEVMRGPVNVDGTVLEYPVVSEVTILDSSTLVDGSTTIAVDTASPCFVRAQVRDATGRMVAFSNPIWFFPEEPVFAVPVDRRAAQPPPPEEPVVFTGSGDAGDDRWHRFEFEVSTPGLHVLRLDQIDADAHAVLHVRRPGGDLAVSDTTDTTLRFLTLDADEVGTWTANIIVKSGATPFRLAIDPTDGPLLAEGEVARWLGAGSSTTARWQEFEFEISEPTPIEIDLDWSDSTAELYLFVKNEDTGLSVGNRRGTSKPKTLSRDPLAVGRYAVGVKTQTGATDLELVVRTF